MRTESKTSAIVLNKINYGEFDRILTLITEDYGKIKVIAKSVRKQKSKMASSLDYFCLSSISFFPNSKGDINRLISSNLDLYFDKIVADIDKINLGFSFMKIIDKTVEGDEASSYFNLLKDALDYVNDMNVNLTFVSNWFHCQFLKIYGHMPNLLTQKTGEKLSEDISYQFSLDDFCFYPSNSESALNKDEIKYLRLLFSVGDIKVLSKVVKAETINTKLFPIIDAMFHNFNLV